MCKHLFLACLPSLNLGQTTSCFLVCRFVSKKESFGDEYLLNVVLKHGMLLSYDALATSDKAGGKKISRYFVDSC